MLQALAIKYRPKSFDELIGQESVSVSLKFALDNGRLAHAYLFSGLRGSGKTSSARIFSRALVCENGPNSHPCGTCKQCIAALENKHLDIIEMDAASNRGIEDIQALIEQTKYAPAMARFKIFIIDEVHMLTPPAANALLKTLEEPPSFVKFILATTDPLKLPATVLSRTQHFRFKQIAQGEILRHLEHILNLEGVKFEPEALKLVARSGGGSLRDTLTLLDQAIIYCQNELTSTKLATMLGLLDPLKIKHFYELILNADKAGLLEFLKELQDYEASSVIDELIFYLKESFFARDESFSMLLYERFFRILSRAKGMLSVSDDDAFVLCVMSFMMIEARALRGIDEQIKELSAENKALGAQNGLQNATQQGLNAPNSTQNSANLGVSNLHTLNSADLNSGAQNVNSTLNSTPNLNATSNLNAKTAAQSPYDKLLQLIYDRNYELGECFERSTKFISFENNVLTISSNAQDEDKMALNQNFKLILELLKKLGDIKLEIKKDELKIDESKLINIAKPTLNGATSRTSSTTQNELTKANDISAKLKELSKDAKAPDPAAEAKEALDELYGSPKVQEN